MLGRKNPKSAAPIQRDRELQDVGPHQEIAAGTRLREAQRQRRDALLPLVVTEPQIDRAVAGVKALLDTMKRGKVAFWGQGLKIGAKLLSA